MNLDEVDINVLHGVVRSHIKHNKWDVSDETEWEQLRTLKDLEARLLQALNGEEA